MLTGIRISTNTIVRASQVKKEQGPFLCPQCREVVILHDGPLTTPHFTHKSYDPCGNSQGETQAHRHAKQEIYESLCRHPQVKDAVLERPFGSVRADIFAWIKGLPVAVEMQISTLSPEAISFRTSEYHKRGIYVLWLLPWTEQLDSPKYSPQQFERWLHATYFGRLYFWRSGLEILPYQFQDKHRLIEKRTWYDERGQLQTAAVYRRTSKRYRITVRGRPLHLVQDFQGVTRPPWESYTLRIPRANLFIDGRKRFERGEDAL